MEENAKLEINGFKINISIEINSIAVTGKNQISGVAAMLEQVVEKLNNTSQILEKIQNQYGKGND